MCGIAGYFSLSAAKATGAGRWDHQAVLTRMTNQLLRRGPDSSGWWAEEKQGVGLGHRRLAIVDLSAEGHQPMHSAHGRYTIVFNGEIYNFQSLRSLLEKTGSTFRGHSDTEVMLAAFESWGIAATLQKMVGMFAFALWDHQEQSLTLARDRFGEKPLYYGWRNGTFVFGSTMNALRACPEWFEEVDRGALALYLRHGYVPAPYSIFSGIRKLTPGSYLTLRAGKAAGRELPEPTVYWSVKEAMAAGVAKRFSGTPEESVAELERLLRHTITNQMIADVPLGAFLSGGVDSSATVAIMQAISTKPVRTFSIGFDTAEYNEAEHAKAVAEHLGTAHTELYVGKQELLEVVPQLPAFYDEPFGDSSQIPTYLVSKMARQHVTVSLSGDAGDELFCGYSNYLSSRRSWDRLNTVPAPLRSLARPFVGLLGSKGKEYEKQFGLRQPELFYRHLMSLWPEPQQAVHGAVEPPTVFTDPNQWLPLPSFEETMMYLDSVSYLTDDILVKVDRASMAVSLESRVPLLDHRIAEFAWSLPLSYKLREEEGKVTTKWALRQVLFQHVPRKLIERPKRGFAVPLTEWLQGPLRPWAEKLIDEKRLRQEGFFEPGPIQALWQQNLAGVAPSWRSITFPMWHVLMFQSWLEHKPTLA